MAAVILLGTLAGCGPNASAGSGKFTPQPDFQGNIDPNPQLTNPGIPMPSLPGGPSGAPGTGSSSSASSADPNVMATKLVEPTGLAVLPDGTALVGERKSGKIYRVRPLAGAPVTLVQTLAGVDGSGDGGLLDLAISPTYAEDGLIYAYLSTASDNRVVHFALGSAPSTVIGGIPRGISGNSGRIAFDATGALLVGTGNAGQPTLAASATSLAGKILRTDDIGNPAAGNPVAGSRVLARGLTTVDGLCVDAKTGLRVAVSGDKLFVIRPNLDYAAATPAATLPASARGGGGCAIGGGELVVATSTGKSLAVAPISPTARIGAFQTDFVGKYGRLRTVVASSDGALWLTTRNRDGLGSPVPDDDRVIRITVSDLDTNTPVV